MAVALNQNENSVQIKLTAQLTQATTNKQT